MTAPAGGILRIVGGGAPRVRRLPELVRLAQGDGWDVWVVLSPAAVPFADLGALTDLTGHAVLDAPLHPDEPVRPPTPTATVMCPATFNSVNKCAAGISDTLACGVVNEAIGLGAPLVLAPAITTAQAAHPAFDRSVELLRAAGVDVIYGDGAYQPTPHGSAEAAYPLELVLARLDAQIRQRAGAPPSKLS